ncbi:hypothetical protein ABDK00_001675 [Niabella insulamsoli]|uniref:hypothetical protein n=1 Tax=Niabella insulamsoli TaxID=3144874 RepID=UPI0031FD6B44
MIDLLLNTDNDLQIANDDVVKGISDLQHQELIIICQKGEFKESPLATVGIVNYLRGEDIPGMLHEVRTRFVNDGIAVRSISYDESNGDLKYDASYSE